MTLNVRGPRAREFVDKLSEYCGLTLLLTGQAVTFSPMGLIDPFESRTLRNLVWDILRSPNVVQVVAFGGNRDPAAGFFFDNFHAVPGYQVPRRSVFVGDILAVERHSTVLARAFMGHVLQEYFGAARPPGQRPGSAFAVYHVPAILTEARIASDLLGRPIWTGSVRPWEATYGNINVRSYGPGMKFQLVFTGSGYLRTVRGP